MFDSVGGGGTGERGRPRRRLLSYVFHRPGDDLDPVTALFPAELRLLVGDP